MALPAHRIPQTDPGEERALRTSDRALLLERVAAGIAHEGKNPLHNMVLHVQLLAEKLASGERQGKSVERHIQSVRDGIGKVDAILRAFGEFAVPQHLPADLGATLARVVLLFQYDARRAGVQVTTIGPSALVVSAPSEALSDIVAHAYVAAIDLARDGGTLDARLESNGPRATLALVVGGGVARSEGAEPHLAAARRLAREAAAELSFDTEAAGGARLYLSFVHPR